LLASLSAALIAASVLVFVFNALRSLARGQRASADPWHARTLEWQVTSPPPVGNFAQDPVVTEGPYEYGGPAPRAGDQPAPATGA
ncbi:MAG TPA: hypothetical protein VFV53_09020, partial [Candidatus Limnocylindrales bacterium]|nr:hypothetical protein [Candidatus Limnocylindrales bacterium]